jgi:putative ABC transport system permease protein
VKFLPLVWSGVWRKPGRTILIFLQVGVAFALFGVLQGLKTGIEHSVAAARADLLIVHGKLSFLFVPLPLGLLETIRTVPGVKLAIPVDIYGATYQKPEQRLGVVAIRPDEDWQSAFTYTIPPEALAAFKKSRTAALVKADLAKKYGWKVGDSIPLQSTTAQQNGSTDWAFDVVGTFTDSDVGGGGDIIVINFDYLDEARHLNKGTVQHFNVEAVDAARAVAVADEIDRRFANSAHETKSESLRELAQTEVQSIGDLNFLIRSIVGAALVALLFSTSTMMMQSLRERTAEFGVLKTIGFTDRAVFVLVLSEALLLCIVAAAFGLALAMFVFPFASRFVPGIAMPGVVVVVGLGFAVLVALISAAVPAVRAARLQVVAALADR